MVTTYILNEDHSVSPCSDMEIWGAYMGNMGSRIVKKTLINESEVSTVFLGVDHNYSFSGIPILFETMVFGPLDPDQDIQERYKTWDQALLGHEKIVKELSREPNQRPRP